MKVRNLNGTSSNRCKCNSWLEHWENFSNQTVKQCVVNGCINIPTVGGHIQKTGLADQSWYIIPICKSCNGKYGEELEVTDKVNLISANVNYTCK
ncbi:hypothetical protein OAR97_06530 [Arcobacteraceae bacterium]|nr:hypothetical protein [Arcobacteraceae bacterium]